MSLNVDKVWLQRCGGADRDIREICPGDRIVIRTGGMIPLDGKVLEGEAMMNQSPLSPESPCWLLSVREGMLEPRCGRRQMRHHRGEGLGSGRYDRVVRMIEESEN